ncbi:MAG: aminomethyltransferase family protein [Hyphomicrobium sp.]|jgi:aminomethyltransferase
MSVPLPRQSALNDRHRALGSDLSQSWNNMPIAQFYATDPYLETTAKRTAAGLIEVTSLQLINLTGSQATECLNYMLTTDIAKMKPGSSHISNIVNENGGLIDDVLLYCNGPTDYRISHGSGQLEPVLLEVSKRFDVKVEIDNDTHILSLQGPVALEVLAPHTPFDLKTLKYFEHTKTTLFGKQVSLARGGYSGERGYEVFCTRADAVFMWDSILAAGRDKGVMHASWTCLDIVRVEAGLLFFPFDMPHKDTTPWEVKADWTVDLSKPDFIGKAALVASKGKERSVITGLEVWHSEAIVPGAKVISGGKEVGVVTSTVYSQHLMKSLAMAQIDKAFTALGMPLEIIDQGKTLKSTVVQMPFYDPMRLRTHPLSERT